ncbi:hypothetical protein DBR32_05165 [Taibaiella sp. KBW10]|uniref:hypothetical protein n=1 Tax=Taibaiella sp. KBW10 TaxID=2153357 RepID=UPI000F5B0ECF|nr:hypothetical protein [Taibaiella sp. KBW10]RQO31355.1 hypothetical protein DBR32_05165 [Taibaiella sp. KBW10]
MQYKSPIRFFDYSHIDLTDVAAINIARVKKQIAAEFSMEPTGIITLEGIDYSKQDIFSIIESAQFATEITHHIKIWAHKSLLQFLESGTVTELLDQETAGLKEDLPFVNFCSPYFAPQFNKEMKNRLSRSDFKAAADWIANCEMILISDGEVAFSSANTYLEDAIKLFRNLNKTTFLSRKAEVTVWTKDWARFLNWLPDNLYSVKDDLATVLINFCVEIQNVDERTCYLISRQMIQLDYLDPTNTKLVRENHEIYEEKISDTDLYPGGRKRRPHKKNSKGLNYIWLILVFVITVVRLMDKGCGNSSSKYSNNLNYVTESNKVNDLVAKLFFERARSASLKNISRLHGSLDTAVQTMPFFVSFFQSVKMEEEATIEVKNSTPEPLYLFVLDDGVPLQMEISQNQSLRIKKGFLHACDFIIGKEEDLKLSASDSLECFTLKQQKVKMVFEQFSDTAVLYLADTSYNRLIRLNIEAKNGKYYLNTPDKVEVNRKIVRLGTNPSQL